MPSPQAVWEGKWRTGFKCLLSVLQLGAEPGEREVLAASDTGADARGSTLIREMLALGFSKEPQRLSAMCWNAFTKVRREIQDSWDSCRAGGSFLQAALAPGTRPCAASALCPGRSCFSLAMRRAEPHTVPGLVSPGKPWRSTGELSLAPLSCRQLPGSVS